MPNVPLETLLTKLEKEYLILPVQLVSSYSFRDGYFTYVPTPEPLPVPLFDKHVFLNPHWHKCYDLAGNLFSEFEEHCGVDTMFGEDTLCSKIVDELGLSIDCAALYGFGSPIHKRIMRKYMKRPPDDFENPWPMLATCRIAVSAIPVDVDMILVEDQIATGLESRDLGRFEGHGQGEGVYDMGVEIAAGKYSEAVTLIKSVLRSQAIKGYKISAIPMED